MKAETRPLYLAALITIGVHFLYSSRAGYFSDETYFIDCSRHLSFGYFDIAPLLPLLIRISQWLFGTSLFGLRFFPALGHAGTVLLGGLIARDLGGRIFAQLLACFAILTAPGLLMLGGLFLSPSLEPFFWTLAGYLVLRILSGKRVELWPLAGAAVGVGFMYKPGTLLLAITLVLGIAISESRRLLLNRRFALGVVIALSIMLPNLIWQTQHEWNMLVFLNSVRFSPQVTRTGWAAFLAAPFLALNPVNAPIWVGGLGYLAGAKDTRSLRGFAWAFPLMLVSLWGLGGKPYYIAGTYPLLLAAGAVLTERLLRGRSLAVRAPLAASYALLAFALTPAGLPILSADATDAYLRTLSLGALSDSLQLRGVRRDMEGHARERLLRELATLNSALDPRERENLVILTSHYFQASWINVLGPEFGLPQAVSGNNSYYERGPGEASGETTIGIGFSEEQLKTFFASVEKVPQDPTILICRHPLRPLREVWPQFRSVPF